MPTLLLCHLTKPLTKTLTKLLALTLLATLLSLTGCGSPSFLVTPVYPADNLSEVTLQEPPPSAKGPGGKIAIVELEGLIVNGRTGGLLQAQENPVNRFAEALSLAAKDQDVKAVVLRVNSPGGSVAASDALYEEVKRFRSTTGKPVIASVQDVGASGAYYVSCAADEIIVSPTSVVGSIGVIFQTFSVGETLRLIGVSTDAIKSGINKDAGSPLRKMTEQERAIFQNMINDYFARFKSVVTSRKGAKLSPDDQTTAFDGRVFTGADAARIGLADRTGQLTDALDHARQLANAPRAKVIMYRLPFSEQGSIYATAPLPPPSANIYTVKLPSVSDLPPGFYYVWQP